jgi:hypothetical protein
VSLQVVRQHDDRPGQLSRCISCGGAGRLYAGRYREPIKPVRAVNVADVHVLAQDMVHHAERKRLLVFADNRQDAAFQAGWMRDHARRFRLRQLIVQQLEQRPLSLGDLTHYLDDILEADDALSHALLPEVWAVEPKEEAGQRHREERRYLLRILLLREITIPAKQQLGLEPWGRLRVSYLGLDENAAFVRHWANHLGLPLEDLAGGIAALLDQERRRRLLLDRTGRIFSRIWAVGAKELESGYLPQMRDVPKALKLTRAGDDDTGRIQHWLSATGHRTTAFDVAEKWGVPTDEVARFLGELWDYLLSPAVALLVPVTLEGAAAARCRTAVGGARSTPTSCSWPLATVPTGAASADVAPCAARPTTPAWLGVARARWSSWPRTRTATTCSFSTRPTPWSGRGSIRPWCPTASGSRSSRSSRARPTPSTPSSAPKPWNWASILAASTRC